MRTKPLIAHDNRLQAAFSIVEMSMVMVFIGLIAGGILIGREMLKNAHMRAQLTQIEQFRAASNTFKTKYGGLPGDLEWYTAQSLGWAKEPRTDLSSRNNNGVLNAANNAMTCHQFPGYECMAFWKDLAYAKMIPDAEPLMNANYPVVTFPGQAEAIDALFPKAKIGKQNVFAYGGPDGFNYLSVMYVYYLSPEGWALGKNDQNTPPDSAQAIDSKVDDGKPLTGRVLGGPQSEGTRPGAALSSGCIDAAGNYVSDTESVEAPGCVLQLRLQ